MATTAQIEANRRNAQKSKGPRTEAGKKKARLNALKHGRRAKAVAPVLPELDPAEIEDRVRQWVEDMKPADAAERKLVERAAKTSLELDALDRLEADRRSERLQDARSQLDDETADQVCDLGRKLLALPEKRTAADPGTPRDDDPRALLRRLEGSAEGCRWLLDRWAELRRIRDRQACWSPADSYRLVRLQGKHPVDAIDDPELNLQFLAWDVIGPGYAKLFWRRNHELTPPGDRGFSASMEWREVVDRPASEEEANAVIYGVITGRIARLEEMLALYEEVACDEAAAAWFDPGPEAEAVRKRQSTLTRELRQLIELILKMQAAPGRRKDREGEAPAERGTAADEPQRRGGRREEEGRPDGIRETSTTEGTEGTEGGRPTEIRQDARAGRERTEKKPAARAGSRKPVLLRGAPERIAEGGQADEARALARAMSVGRPGVPISVTRGPARDTNEPNSLETEVPLWKEDKTRDPGRPEDDRSHR
jgi:hypothetical protein